MENKNFNSIFIGQRIINKKIHLEKFEIGKKEKSFQIGKLGKGIAIRANR